MKKLTQAQRRELAEIDKRAKERSRKRYTPACRNAMVLLETLTEACDKAERHLNKFLVKEILKTRKIRNRAKARDALYRIDEAWPTCFSKRFIFEELYRRTPRKKRNGMKGA